MEPYSREYSTRLVEDGSFPGLRIGTKPQPRRSARSGPKMKPRASGPTTKSGSHPSCWRSVTNRSVMEEVRPGSPRTGVISLNITPSMGKSETVRTESVIREIKSSIAIDSVKGPGGPSPRFLTLLNQSSSLNIHPNVL